MLCISTREIVWSFSTDKVKRTAVSVQLCLIAEIHLQQEIPFIIPQYVVVIMKFWAFISHIHNFIRYRNTRRLSITECADSLFKVEYCASSIRIVLHNESVSKTFSKESVYWVTFVNVINSKLESHSLKTVAWSKFANGSGYSNAETIILFSKKKKDIEVDPLSSEATPYSPIPSSFLPPNSVNNLLPSDQNENKGGTESEREIQPADIPSPVCPINGMNYNSHELLFYLTWKLLFI